MSSAQALATRPIAIELHALLRELDPARWRADASQALRARIEEIERRVEALRASLEQLGATSDESVQRLREQVAAVDEVLRSRLAELKQRADQGRDEWMAFRTRLTPAYEQLALVLRAEAVHVPSLRPTNYLRSLVHVGFSFFAFGVIQFLATPAWMVGIAGAFLVYAWSVETLRRRNPGFNDRVMKMYGPIAHDHERHRVNSATWYTTALFLLSLTGSHLVCSIAVLVLGVGDPAAAVVGRRFGKTKLINGRSLEGSLAFVAVATVVCGATLLAFRDDVTLASAFTLAAIGAVAGAIAELVSRRIDDNFTIPLAAGLAAWAGILLLA